MSSSETNNSDGPAETPVLEGGVFAALPRARPQRSSPRRDAARAKAGKRDMAASAEQSKTPPAKSTKRSSQSATKKAKASSVEPKTKPASTKPAEPPAPKQGYEPEEEFELGNTVDPPSGVEVVESVADIVGELANSGLAAGGRILKDAFALFRRP